MLPIRILYLLLLLVMPIRVHADIYDDLRNLIVAKTDSSKHDSTIPDNFDMRYIFTSLEGKFLSWESAGIGGDGLLKVYSKEGKPVIA